MPSKVGTHSYHLFLSESVRKSCHKEERPWISYTKLICFSDILAKNISSSYSLWNNDLKERWLSEEVINGTVISSCWSWNLFWWKDPIMELNKTWWVTPVPRFLREKRHSEKTLGKICCLCTCYQALTLTWWLLTDCRQSFLKNIITFRKQWPTDWIWVNGKC